jgi:hypothetical protein
MGVSIRLINISGSTSYSVAYSTSPYGSFTTALTGTTSTATISGAPFEFDTQYYIKLTDLVTNRYIIENIYIHDSKAYPFYDTIDFDLSASCVPPAVTPTATPTLTLTSTPTQTLTASIGLTSTPTPTLTLTKTPTQTPTPTTSLAEPLPGCGDTVSGTYIPTGFTIQTQALDLSEATDESIISVGYVAYDRPNRFNIYGNGMLIGNSGWVGADNTYAGPWGTAGSLTDPDGTGSFTFVYQAGMSYELRVDVGPSNPDGTPPNPSDGWSVTFTCLGPPTPTPTATLIPDYYNVKVQLVGKLGTSGNLTVRQSSDGITFINSVTITTTDNEVAQQFFNGTPGYYYYFLVARTSGSSNRLNWYTQVSPSDFSPGAINGAGCSEFNGATLQSDTFQLPNPVQSVSQVLLYGDISDECI